MQRPRCSASSRFFSRFQPAGFPERSGRVPALTRTGLNFPVEYWNGRAALMAIGVAGGNLQSYAATPALQEALVLEERGKAEVALALVRDATEIESTIFRTWLILSRIQAELGNLRPDVRAHREARSLSPRSPVFDIGDTTE